jgi:hypothetical protein
VGYVSMYVIGRWRGMWSGWDGDVYNM